MRRSKRFRKIFAMPNWNHIVRQHLAALRLPPERESEIIEEIALHLEAVYEDALATGLSEAEAESRALQGYDWRLLECELSRAEQPMAARVIQPSLESIERRGGMRMGSFIQDLRFGVRMLRKNPGFTLIAVLSLGLGIGANTAIFSIVDAALLKLLPVKEPGRLVMFKSLAREDFIYGAYNSNTYTDPTTGLQAGDVFPTQSYARMRAWAQRRDSPCEVFAFSLTDANVTVDGQAESLQGLVVSGNYYTALGVQAALGRVITDDDDKAGASPVVVFSHRYWERRFNSDPAVIGKHINVNNVPFTVIGVTQRGFDGTGEVGSAPQVFVPIAVETQINPSRKRMVGAGWWWLRLMARLKPGATMEQARVYFDPVFHQSVVEHGSLRRAKGQDFGIRMLPNLEPKDYPRLAVDSGNQGESSMRQDLAPRLYLLFGIVGLVLLIACANVANLFLARAAGRQKEIALRLALGAGRFRLLRQLLTESILLAVLGAGFGILFARWIKDVLLSVRQWGVGMEALDPQLDLRVLTFTFLLSLLTGILFGIAPAYRATRVDLTPALKDTGRNSSGIGRSWLSKGLVVIQVALSFLLLAGAGLMLRTLHNLQNTEAGFNRENLLLFTVTPGQLGYKGERLASLYRGILERLDAVPGARSVTCSSETLLSTGYWDRNIFVSGAAVRVDANNRPIENGGAMILGVRENFLETMGIPLLQGRTLRPQDDEHAPRVAVVNRAFAKRFFPNESPIGKRFGFEAGAADQIEIVGLAADAKYTSMRDEIKPTTYFPWSQEVDEFRYLTYEIRTVVEPTALVSAVREAVRSVESNLPVNDIKTQIEQSDETLRTERLFTRLLSFFGVLALLLAGIGLYGVLAYAVAQRTQEIGIRLALGAQTHNILRLIVGQGMLLALIGVMLGSCGALGLTRLTRSMLYGVSPTDLHTFVIIAVVLLVAALLACWIPARRATRVDPLVALHHE